MTLRKGALALVLSAAFLGVAGEVRPLHAADFTFTPSISLSEEYNDNIFETASDRRTDYVTRIVPGATLSYHAPRLNTDAHGTFDYRTYARKTKADDEVYTLALQGNLQLVENFFFLDLSDNLSRVSLNVTRDVSTESLFVNQADQNTATVSPYLLWRLGNKTALRTGYRYTDTRYWNSSGSSGIDKKVQNPFAEATHELTDRLSLSARYDFNAYNTSLIRYDQHDVSGQVKYEYGKGCLLFGGVGNSWQIFSGARSTSNLFWNVGVTHDFGTMSATVETRVQYAEDPLSVSTKETSYSAGLKKSLQHGSFGLSASYAEYVATLGGGPDRHQVAFAGSGLLELAPRFTATLSAAGDRVSDSADGYPYHWSGSAAVSYGFNYDILAALTYTYVEYRRELGSSVGARQTNRVILDVSKAF